MRVPAQVLLPPGRIAIASVAGLLLAVVVAGLVGLTLINQVQQVTNRALLYDIELEDEGDDVRVAVLELRHHHRNIRFQGPSERRIIHLERAYAALLEELGELEELASRYPIVPDPLPMLGTAQRYYPDFRAAVDLYHADPTAFAKASDEGLVRLADIQNHAEMLDEMGDERADASLRQVDDASNTARLVLLAVIIGLVLVGAGLAWTTMHMLAEIRRLYVQQRATAEVMAMANKAKTDFIADVSHELRTPLTVLRGNAEVGLQIERDGVLAPMLAEIVKESAPWRGWSRICSSWHARTRRRRHSNLRPSTCCRS